MAIDYIYPLSSEITQIGQVLMADLTMNDPIFDIMPIREVNTNILEWEQVDNYRGMQMFRGLDGDPARVQNVGAKRYIVQPGVYGEFMRIDEREMTTRRRYGTWGGTVIDLEDLIMEKTEQLLHRRVKRLKYVGWQVLVYGHYTILAPNGAVSHKDAFQNQSYVSAVPWSSLSTATPLQDLRNIKLLSLGKSVSFGGQSKLYVNQITVNNAIANTNPLDLGGKRTAGLQSVFSLADVNKILMQEDLPQLVPYEGGYEDDTGTFQRFIPGARGVIVGSRSDNADIMEYRLTVNMQNADGQPGFYMKVVDTVDREVPRKIDVHDGHNGGPVIYFPSAVVSAVF